MEGNIALFGEVKVVKLAGRLFPKGIAKFEFREARPARTPQAFSIFFGFPNGHNSTQTLWYQNLGVGEDWSS